MHLQIANPRKLTLLGTTGIPEKVVHVAMATYRVRGEWFIHCKEVLDYIASVKGMTPSEKPEHTGEPLRKLSGFESPLFGVGQWWRRISGTKFQVNELGKLR